MSIVDGIKKYMLRPRRILIVEDDASCADAIKTALRDYDCDFTVAADGGSAVDLVQHQDFDLVFLDIKLPVLSGVEVLRYIKNVKPNLPVVMMSGYFTQDILDETLQSGIVAFLRKPEEFSPNRIAGVLNLFNLRPVMSDRYVQQHGAVPA